MDDWLNSLNFFNHKRFKAHGNAGLRVYERAWAKGYRICCTVRNWLRSYYEIDMTRENITFGGNVAFQNILGYFTVKNSNVFVCVQFAYDFASNSCYCWPFEIEVLSFLYVRQVNVKTNVVVGDPKEKVCEAVQNLNADLLVMGSRAFGPIKRCKLINKWPNFTKAGK